MDVAGLNIDALFTPEGEETEKLRFLGAEKNEILLAPLFSAFEGEEGTLRLQVPREYELEHLAKGLAVPVRVIRSDLRALVVETTQISSDDEPRWKKLLDHFQERVGQMARVYPRVESSEFNFEIIFTEAGDEPGRIFDLSQGGMRVLSDLVVHPGDEFPFTLRIPKAHEWAKFVDGMIWRGKVRSIHPRGFGLQFEEGYDFSEAIRKLVDQLMEFRAQRLKHPRYNIFEYNVSAYVRSIDSIESGPKDPKGNEARLKDISIAGSYLLMDEDLALDTPVELRVQPKERFENVKEGLSLLGRVVRATPDGLVVKFEELSDKTDDQLKAWVEEVGKMFGFVSKAEEPKAVKTLTINYGSDLLFVREYLYNLSTGGLFFPGKMAVAKDDVVEFVIDLSATSLAKTFSEPPTFLGKVVRNTEQGIGVQFLNPDQVRAKLESVLGDLLRKHKDQVVDDVDLGATARRIAEAPLGIEIKPKPARTSKPRVPFAIPTRLMVWVSVGVISVGMVVYSYRSSQTPVVLELDGSAPISKSAKTPPPMSPDEKVEKRIPAKVRLVVNNKIVSVQTADIVDVTYDRKEGPRIVLKDGSIYPGKILERYLPPGLQKKLAQLVYEDMQQAMGWPIGRGPK